jgi:hypothetical protein
MHLGYQSLFAVRSQSRNTCHSFASLCLGIRARHGNLTQGLLHAEQMRSPVDR